MKLYNLEPGAHFRVPRLDIEATLVRVNECGAAVRLGTTHARFTTVDGQDVQFDRPGRVVYWTSDVDVVPCRQTIDTAHPAR